MPSISTINGDSREALLRLEDASIDAAVTDPPYEYGFMGKDWDRTGIAFDPTFWAGVLRVLKPGGHLLAFGAPQTYHRMACAAEDAGFVVRDSWHWFQGQGMPKSKGLLKPGHEPILCAVRPSKKAPRLNIDACRLESGRWPSNVFLSEEAANELDAQTGILTSGKAAVLHRNSDKFRNTYSSFAGQSVEGATYGDSGGASRFFYVAKAKGAEERGEDNDHPTVKPVSLMRQLVRLVTPLGGRVLDPFMGSGSTGVACKLEGLSFVGIEKDRHYLDIAQQRIGEAAA